MSDVPCAGCTLCCRGNQFIPLMDNDPADFYKTQQIAGIVGLAWKFNGDCIYVTDTGCSIHERAPQVCRFYDCRGHFASQPHPELAAAEDPIMARGRELLNVGLSRDEGGEESASARNQTQSEKDA